LLVASEISEHILSLFSLVLLDGDLYTRPTYKPALAEFSLTEVSSYKMFEKHIDREEDRGLVLYLDNKLEATEIHMEINFQENLFVKIKLNQTDKLLVGLVYRSPSNSVIELVSTMIRSNI
jgi:hypothetical protein